jgi:hypothetical protein
MLLTSVWVFFALEFANEIFAITNDLSTLRSSGAEISDLSLYILDGTAGNSFALALPIVVILLPIGAAGYLLFRYREGKNSR